MEHPSLFRNRNIFIANIETENSVSNFITKPIHRYFSIRLETEMPFYFENLETKIAFLFCHYFSIGLETKILFLFCTFRNGNALSILQI